MFYFTCIINCFRIEPVKSVMASSCGLKQRSLFRDCLNAGDERKHLLIAAEAGHDGCVESLLSAGADVNTQDEISGDTALMLAAQNGHNECSKLLIEAGTDVNIKDQHGGTAVILAAAGGHEKCVELLIQAGPNVNDRWYSDTALLLAIRGGHDTCVQLLINGEADVNLGCEQRLTALMYATGGDWRNPQGNPKWADLLLAAGADVNEQRHGYTALRYAAEHGLFEISEILVKGGANVNIKYEGNHTALLIAALNKHKACINSLVRAGADVNIVDGNGDTALIYSVKHGFHECVNTLAEAGAAVNFSNTQNKKALLIAANNADTACVNILGKAGADVNSLNSNGESALTVLVQSESNQSLETMKCLETLIKFGADVDHVVQYCAMHGLQLECLKLLLAAGAIVNVADEYRNLIFPNGHPQIYGDLLELIYASGGNIGGITEKVRKSLIQMEPEIELCLSYLCRESIRKHLLGLHSHLNLFVRVPRLGLPAALQSYLLYDKSIN